MTVKKAVVGLLLVQAACLILFGGCGERPEDPAPQAPEVVSIGEREMTYDEMTEEIAALLNRPQTEIEKETPDLLTDGKDGHYIAIAGELVSEDGEDTCYPVVYGIQTGKEAGDFQLLYAGLDCGAPKERMFAGNVYANVEAGTRTPRIYFIVNGDFYEADGEGSVGTAEEVMAQAIDGPVETNSVKTSYTLAADEVPRHLDYLFHEGYLELPAPK